MGYMKPITRLSVPFQAILWLYVKESPTDPGLPELTDVKMPLASTHARMMIE